MYIFEPILVYHLGLVKLENNVPALLITNKIAFIKLLACYGGDENQNPNFVAGTISGSYHTLDGPFPNHERPERKFIFCRQS